VKRFAHGIERHREAITALLDRLLRAPGTVLEIGAGTGQHAVFFAAAMPSIVFVPSEKDPGLVDSIDAWRADAALPNLRAPRLIDVTAEEWDAPPVTAILAIDLCHAAPWPVTVGLLTGAGRVLPPGGDLLLVGPFRRAPASLPRPLEELDAELRQRSPHLGVRDLGEITTVAQSRGLRAASVHELPGHNLCAVFRTSSSSG
jgi:SAM-dependent methyltransferase